MTIGVELTGVLVIGTLSHPSDIDRASVWSDYGNGYGFVPLVLPVVGLWWLWHIRPQPPGYTYQSVGEVTGRLIRTIAPSEDLGAVHLPQRVGQQLEAGAVGVAEVDRLLALHEVLDAGGVELAP